MKNIWYKNGLVVNSSDLNKLSLMFSGQLFSGENDGN